MSKLTTTSSKSFIAVVATPLRLTGTLRLVAVSRARLSNAISTEFAVFSLFVEQTEPF